jgi:hypothetical protein
MGTAGSIPIRDWEEPSSRFGLRLIRRIGSGFHIRLGQAVIQASSACDRPPVVEKDFKWAPVGNPAEYQEAFLYQTLDRSSGQIPTGEMRCGEAQDEDQNADDERAPANSQKLFQIVVDHGRSVREIPAEGIAQLARCGRLSDTVGKMDDNSDRLVCREFARPSDYEVLSLAVEVSLSKWKWVEGVKKLCDVVDAQLDRVREDAGCHIYLGARPVPDNPINAGKSWI